MVRPGPWAGASRLDHSPPRQAAGRPAVLGAVALAAGTASWVVGRYRAVHEVPAELRAGWLYLPTVVPPVMPWPSANRAAALVARRLMRRENEVVPGVTVRHVSIVTRHSPRRLRAVVYEPVTRSKPSGALLWIHGGDLVAGCPEQDHDLCSGIAERLGALVLSVDYRLAPEHPHPAAHDDCYEALVWLHQQADALQLDIDRIAVGGASAGGGLAATVAQRAYDEKLSLAFQLLVYPMLDDRTTRRRGHGGRGRLAFTPALNRYGWTCYLGHRSVEEQPDRYAVAARRQELSGLPPAWIGVGDLDLLHDEAVGYASRLRAAGVACELHVEPGMYHGADVGLASTVDSMRGFRDRMADALGDGLSVRRGPVGD